MSSSWWIHLHIRRTRAMADHLSTNVLHIFCSLRDESDEGRESHVTFSLKLDCLRYSFTVSAQSWMNPFLRNRKTFMDFLYWDIFPCLHHGNSSERQQSCISLNSQFNISSSSKHGGTKIRGYNKSIWRTSWSNRYYVVTLKVWTETPGWLMCSDLWIVHIVDENSIFHYF